MRRELIIVVISILLLSSGVGVVANNDIITTPHSEVPGNSCRSRGVIVVDKDGFGDYTSIQTAIDKSNQGDTIYVQPGEYAENIKIDKKLSLIGNSSKNPRITGDPNDNGIYITADRVSVGGFRIELSLTMADEAGIYLYKANNCTIENNYIAGIETAIQLSNSDLNTIRNNECNNNYYGIWLFSSDSNNIQNNTMVDSESKAIAIQSSLSNIVINNTCNRKGIWLGNSMFTQLYKNYMFYSSVWITGDILSHWDSHTIGKDNLVNGKPLYYWKNKLGQTIPSDAGAVILVKCKNIVVKDLDVSDVTVGVELGYSERITIDNITFHASSYYYNNYAIYLNESHNNTITNVDCKHNLFGIRLETSNFNTISRNVFVYSNYAIYLYHSEHNIIHNNFGTGNWHEIELAYSNSNLITNNIGYNSSHGLYISESSLNVMRNNTYDINNGLGLDIRNSDNNTFINDTCVNGYQGIILRTSSYNKFIECKCLKNLKGIVILSSWENEIINSSSNNNYEGIDLCGDSKNNIVINNTLWNNTEGIHINYSAKNNNITDNLVYNNSQAGIIVEYLSNNNIIFKNMIISNSQQALDDNLSHWNDSSEGNYWSDYQSRYPSASNNGHVWNISYEIPGLGGAKDYYPLVNNTKKLPQNTKPIAVIDDITPNLGTEGLRVTFWGRVIDEDHVAMTYHWESDLDGLISDQPVFTSQTLSVGNHTISFKVQDYDGLWSDTVEGQLKITKQLPRPPYKGPKRMHKRIYIRGNDEFTKENGVEWGTGTKENPFIIEGWEITVNEYNGISIRDTNVYFIIRNCNVTFGVTETYDYYSGIYLNDVENGSIEDNFVIKFRDGIDLYDSLYNTIINNTVNSNSEAGIKIMGHVSNSNQIFNNTCNSNEIGISLRGQNNILMNNSCKLNSESGIVIEGTMNTITENLCNWNIYNGIMIRGDSNEIINNICYNNSFGISIEEYTSGNSLTKNKLEGNSEFGIYYNTHFIEFLELNNYIFEDNIINGKNIEWYCNRNESTNPTITIKDKEFVDSKMNNLANILIYNCSNFRIENVTISNQVGGIFLYGSKNIEIISNYLNNTNHFGIYLMNSNHNLILNNNLTDNGGIYLKESGFNSILNNNCTNASGIKLSENCNYNKIENNICQYSGYGGIYFQMYCNNNFILNNTCLNNYNGIILSSTSNNIIVNNNCLKNTGAGIYVLGNGSHIIKNNNCSNNEHYGIHIYFCEENIISNNTCSDNRFGTWLHYYTSNNTIKNNSFSSNNKSGIIITESNDNEILNNSIVGNGEYGINCTDSYRNRFFHNYFIDNSGENSQCFDNSISNKWDNGYPSGGNYWSDYKGIDNRSGQNQDEEGGDGIGDVPYIIAGGVNQDNYPLLEQQPEKNYSTENIIITLELLKSDYYEGESIIGLINISNKNSFDIELNNQPFQTLSGIFFNIQSTDNYNEFQGIFNYLYNIEIEANSYLLFEFQIEDYIVLPITSKDVTYTVLEPGNYSMYSYFFYDNNTIFEKLTSNRVYFRINDEIPQDIMNITITIDLSKSEFYFTEPITGYLNISNNNSFDITLGNPVYIQEGEHFTIQSLQNLSRYYGFFTNQFFPIIIKSKDLKIIEFKIDRYLILPIKSQYNNYTQLSAGNYSVFIDLYYGINTNFTKIKSNIEIFRIIENESVINGTTEPNPGNGYNGLSQSFIVYSTVAVIVIILLIITTFIAGTEIGKYTFFGGIVPLYTKTRRKKLDKNYGYKKGLVLGYILGTPGESYNAIKRVLNLNNGVLAYYLRVLEREEAIKSERDGMYKRFYPTRGNITKEVLELTDVQKDIYKTIKEHLGITQKEISSLLGVTQSKVNYHVKMMVDARLLRMDREGKRTRCFILEEDSQEV